jgi:endonuclease YncB( thermonuclease family)
MVDKISFLAMKNTTKYVILLGLTNFWFVMNAHAGNQEYLNLLMKVNRVNYIRSQHNGFLGSVSVGRVRSIRSPTTFKLENGIEVRLLGIDDPMKYGDSPKHKHFAKLMKDYLSKKLKGRLVILRQDRTDFDDSMVLLRYVYLPGWDKGEKEVFFNAQMIKDGYAKPYFEGKNKNYEAVFKDLVKEVYKNPKGAWLDVSFNFLTKNKSIIQ